MSETRGAVQPSDTQATPESESLWLRGRIATAAAVMATLAVAGCAANQNSQEHGPSASPSVSPSTPTETSRSSSPSASPDVSPSPSNSKTTPSASPSPVDLSGICLDWQTNPDAKDTLQKSLQAVVAKDIVGQLAPGATVAAGCGVQTLAMFAVGDDGQGKEISASKTEYDLASVSKSFTAIGIFMLEQQGKLSLQDKVSKYFPNEYGSGDKANVTIEMLLQHTSGLVDPDYSEVTDGTYSTDKVAQANQVRQNVRNYPLKGMTGDYSYSNFGYSVLYDIATQVANQQLSDYLKRQLFGPLGMQQTTPYVDGLTNCAPTSPDDDQSLVFTCIPQDQLAQFEGNISGHAGWFSTASDMANFVSWIASDFKSGNKTLLDPKYKELAATTIDDDDHYSTGFMTNTDGYYFGDKMSAETFGHTGWNGTEWSYDPQSGLWSVVLSNGTFHAPAPKDAADTAFNDLNDALVTASEKLPK